MTGLKKYELDFQITHKYFIERLTGVNTLSNSVVNFTPFEKGSFFTILSKGLTKEMVYDFQNIHVAHGAQEHIAELLFKEQNASTKKICIFDDYNEEFQDGNNWDLFNDIGVHFEKEMYYIITFLEKNKNLYLRCLQSSNVVWHGLCILSKSPYKRKKDQNISEIEMQSLCKTADLVLLVAYDAESYIIWERSK